MGFPSARTAALRRMFLSCLTFPGQLLFMRVSIASGASFPLPARKCSVSRGKLAPDAIETLMNSSWPGNVRQLRNILLRAAVLADGNPITREMLEVPDEAAREGSMLTESARVSREQELKMIHDALTRCDGNRSRAAKLLGISYRTLLNRLRDHGQA